MPEPIRFAPTGPEGWLAAPGEPLEHAELLKGTPVGLDHAYFTRPEAGLRAGIWRSGPYTERYDGYPVDEFMVVLDGEVTLESDDGFRDTYRKGDAFLLPKGFRGVWHQPVAMLKYYVIIG
ncbi:cupin domain-containing protein [Aestuariivirga sp.]|uniref:cupin domain-containing protein n=1 Tax=Aestuariivirga sp. TaxID=2650926 RepID=UPI00391C21C9